MEPTTRVTLQPSQPAELSQTETYQRKRTSPVIPEAKEAIIQSTFVGVDCVKTVVVEETKLVQNSQSFPQKHPKETPPKWMKTTDPIINKDCDAEPKQSKDCGQQLSNSEATLKSDTENDVKPAKTKWKRPEEGKDQTGLVLNEPTLNSYQNKISQETPEVLQKQSNKASIESTKTVSKPENKVDCDNEPEHSKDCGLKENKKPQLNNFDAPLKSDSGNEVKPAKPKWKRPEGVKEQTGPVLNKPRVNSSQNKKLDISEEIPKVLQNQPIKVLKVSTKTVSNPANASGKSSTKPIELDMKVSMRTSGILDTKSKETHSNLNANNTECTKKVSDPATKLSDKLESKSIKPMEKISSSNTKLPKKALTKTEDIKTSSLPAKCDEMPPTQSLNKSPKECQDKVPMQQSPSTNPLEMTKVGRIEKDLGTKNNAKYEARECPKIIKETEKIKIKSQKSPERQADIPKTLPKEIQPDPITMNEENNPHTKELKNTKVGEEAEEEEDASGMRAMRKEVGNLIPLELNNFLASRLI